MKRGLKRFLKACAFIAGGVVLLIAAAVILVVYDKPLIKKTAQKFVFNKTGITMTIGRLDYRLFPLNVEASSVKLSYATPVFSIEVDAPRVGLRGDFKKLLKGKMPALDSAEAEIAEILVSQAKKSPEPIDFQRLVLQLADTLNYSRRISLRCGRMVVLLLNTDFRGDNTTLAISGGKAGGVFEIALDSENVAWVLNGGKMSIGGPLRADGELSLGRAAGFDLHLAMAKPRFAIAGKTAAVDSLAIGALGTWQPDTRTAGLDLHLCRR